MRRFWRRPAVPSAIVPGMQAGGEDWVRHERPVLVTRLLTRLAVATGGVAIVLLFAFASSDGSGDEGGAGWIAGLLIIGTPLLCAVVVSSITRSRLLRPVGAAAVLIAALAAAVHVAIVGDGPRGWWPAIPALATPLLLLAAVIRGPEASRSVTYGELPGLPRAPEPAPQAPQDWTGHPSPDGPALDVLNPLRSARSHAVKDVVAWIVAASLLATSGVPVFRLLGWPAVVARLDAEVVEVVEVKDGTAVSFEADGPRGRVRWTLVAQETSFEVGDHRRAVLDDNNEVHWEETFGLAGMPLLLPALLLCMFAALSVRRLWGLVVALADLRHGADRPRLGYAAVIDDPAPKTMRPLVPVWERDPTTAARLAKPDVVYRADGDTSTHLESAATDVEVRQAWIDTGSWSGAKPRWIGFSDGVAVPHRRSFLGRWYVHRVTRKTETPPPAPLRHSAPDYRLQAAQPAPPDKPHRLVGMLLWRLLLVAAGVGLAFFLDEGGHAAQVLSTTMAFWRPNNPTSKWAAL